MLVRTSGGRAAEQVAEVAHRAAGLVPSVWDLPGRDDVGAGVRLQQSFQRALLRFVCTPSGKALTLDPVPC